MESITTTTAPSASQHPSPDAAIVARVLGGDKEAYAQLVRRHNQKLYRTIRSYLREEDEVEDAMQDTYLLAYQKLPQLKSRAFFSTWLIRIGINVALGKLREKRTRTVGLALDGDEYGSLPLSNSRSTLINPEEMAIHQEIKLLLEKAIDHLPEKYRIVYILREVEGMDLPEIGQCLGLSESNTKVRLHRAKEMLKETLQALSVHQGVFGYGAHRCDAMVARVMAILRANA
ncbi:RNA polymerase sigma factor [Rufibacter psychrotolerans]|uniref:RNA polymerase sigma factor n=1 Tax=Rufibacter psychrotolerans TaxID=2812556 RepID=UPI001967003B|nr:RNA polymerase sigma factor [Rufibacter sp. SYSU D00308]